MLVPLRAGGGGKRKAKTKEQLEWRTFSPLTWIFKRWKIRARERKVKKNKMREGHLLLFLLFYFQKMKREIVWLFFNRANFSFSFHKWKINSNYLSSIPIFPTTALCIYFHFSSPIVKILFTLTALSTHKTNKIWGFFEPKLQTHSILQNWKMMQWYDKKRSIESYIHLSCWCLITPKRDVLTGNLS